MNKTILKKQINDFVDYVVYHDNNSEFLSFKGSPFLKSEEGFKDSLANAFGTDLSKLNFSETDIGTGKLLDLVIEHMFSPKNILVHYKQKTLFRNAADSNQNKAEAILYNIYYSTNDVSSFEEARKFFGNKYDLIAYLFFLKDSNNYLPIRSSIFDQSFSILGINDYKASGNVNWNNYNQFIGIISSIQKELRKQFYDNNITLLNAHSFVWMAKGVHDFATSGISSHSKKESESTKKNRIGQKLFRDRILDFWDEKCSVTGCKNTSFLSAAHIKPWSDCTTYEESVDVHNGLLLTPNLHEAFDLGLISFDMNGNIMISSSFKESDYTSLGISSSMKLKKELTKAHQRYIEYRNNNIFIK